MFRYLRKHNNQKSNYIITSSKYDYNSEKHFLLLEKLKNNNNTFLRFNFFSYCHIKFFLHYISLPFIQHYIFFLTATFPNIFSGVLTSSLNLEYQSSGFYQPTIKNFQLRYWNYHFDLPISHKIHKIHQSSVKITWKPPL